MICFGRRYSSTGFTLVELMITLVIVAILLSLAAPGFKSLLERNRLQTAAHGFFTDLVLARSEAIKRNQAVVLCKSNTGVNCTVDTAVQWEQGWLVFADTDNDGAVDPNEIITVKNALHVGDTLRTDTAGDFKNQVTYGTDGSASGSEVFVLCNEDADLGNAREIDIAATGRPRLQLTSADCTP